MTAAGVHVERRTVERRRRWLQLGSYLLLVALIVGVFHYVGVRDYQRCRRQNAQGRAVRQLVAYSTRNTNQALPIDTPESVRELVRRGRVQAVDLVKYVNTHLVDEVCTRPWPG